jgi:LPXTG-site transpeptidase (sortase) family protein
MKLSKKQRLLVGLVSLFGIGGLFVALSVPRPAPQSVPEVITYSTDQPIEEPPPKDYKWSGGESDPKRIILPTVSVDGFVQRVGVDQNKEVAVPDNIHMAGWFINTAQPGQKGLSVIDGHVDGREQGGIFRRLKELRKDDEFQIELGSGDIKRFKVMQITEVNAKEAASILFSQSPKVTSQLNLITCGGTYDKASQRYDKRVIVSASLL